MTLDMVYNVRMVNARNKGHAWERDIMHMFHKSGWEFVGTSRNYNRMLDAEKIDLVGTNFMHIQCKCTSGSMNYAKYLDKYPQVNVIAHKRTDTHQQLFVLTRACFESILKRLDPAI